MPKGIIKSINLTDSFTIADSTYYFGVLECTDPEGDKEKLKKNKKYGCVILYSNPMDNDCVDFEHKRRSGDHICVVTGKRIC